MLIEPKEFEALGGMARSKKWRSSIVSDERNESPECSAGEWQRKVQDGKQIIPQQQSMPRVERNPRNPKEVEGNRKRTRQGTAFLTAAQHPGHVHVIYGDLLDTKERVIAHQANCVTRDNVYGVAKSIFERYPQADVYRRRADEFDSTPGTIDGHNW